MAMRTLLILMILNFSSESLYSQKEYFKSDTLNISTASIDGISDDANLILNINSDYSTICFFRDNRLVQKRPLSGEKVKLRGLLEQGNYVHVFYGSYSKAKQNEGVLTFYKDQSKNPTYEFNSIEDNFLFSYSYGGEFHRVIFSKKGNKIIHRTFRFNQPDSIKEISISDKAITKALKEEFIYNDSSTQDFEQLATSRKAFREGNKLILLIDQDNSTFSPELIRVIIDFNEGTIDYKEIKHPFKPKTEHLSSFLEGKIFTWGINLDYFAMSIVDLNTLRSEKILLYLKQSNKIELKATPINYSVGPPLNDNNWEWKDTSIKTVDESKAEDVLRQFLKGSIAFRAIKRDDAIQFLFGTYQASVQPSTTTYTSTVGVSNGISPGANPTSYFSFGVGERRKYFFGYLNSKDLTPITTFNTLELFIRNRLDERIKSLFDEEKIGGIGGIVGFKKGFVAYLLKKEKELIIEEL